MILTQYILAEFCPPLAFGIVIFSFVLVLDKLFDMADLIFNRGVPTILVTKLFVIFLPTVVPLTLPMAVLLAALITYGRLAQDGEITAVRTSGLSLWQITWPVLALAALGSVFLVPFNREITPRAHAYFRKVFSQMVQSDPLLQIEPRRFFEVRDLRLYANAVDKVHERLSQVILYRIRPDVSPADRIFARKGTYEQTRDTFRLKLEDGQFERYDPQDSGKLMHARFQTYSIDVPVGFGQADSSVDLRDLTATQLTLFLREKRMQGLPTYEIESERELRHAIALAPLALGFLGVPIGMVLDRGGKTMGFGASAAVLFAYYLVLVFGLSLAEKGAVPHGLSIWGADVLCMVFGSLLLRKMLRK